MPGLKKTHLTGCIGEIIGFYKTLDDQKTSYIREYLMKKWLIGYNEEVQRSPDPHIELSRSSHL